MQHYGGRSAFILQVADIDVVEKRNAIMLRCFLLLRL